jgi:hypothetical protein
MQIVIAVLMALHGVAHVPGFAVSWRLADLQGMPYHTALFGGRVYVGDAGMRAVGILWLFAALAFVAIGVAALLNRSWWSTAAVATITLSLGLCTTEIKAARVGVIANLVLLALVLAARAAARSALAP